MRFETSYLMAADALLVIHTCIVLFVTLGLPLILAGGWRNWGWVRNPWFRYAHLGAIIVVILQAWLGAICPLTTWELKFRIQGGDPTYEGSFMTHWLSSLIYWQAPVWVFTLTYTLFGIAVCLAWIRIRPRRFGA
jgi:hypothetical protein